MKIVVLFQIRTGDGNPERTKQNRRPAWASKKEWEFSTMADVDGYTAPRVHEPVGWAISNRFQPVSSGIFEIRFDSSQFAQPCRIDSEKKWTFKIRGDHRWWMVQRFLSQAWSIVSMRWQLMLTGISGCRSIASWWSERCSCSISTLCGSDEWFGASWIFELGS